MGIVGRVVRETMFAAVNGKTTREAQQRLEYARQNPDKLYARASLPFLLQERDRVERGLRDHERWEIETLNQTPEQRERALRDAAREAGISYGEMEGYCYAGIEGSKALGEELRIRRAAIDRELAKYKPQG